MKVTPIAQHGLFSRVLPMAAALIVAACAGTAKENLLDVGEAAGDARKFMDNPFKAEQPVALTWDQSAGIGGSSLALDMPKLQDAIERHARAKRELSGTYVVAGSDLKGDGKPQALVLFTSENWCQPQGCPLVIFGLSGSTYRPITTINRVRPPILVSMTENEGWRDIWVKTGKDGQGQKLPLQNARLRFQSGSYPATASFATSATIGTPSAKELATPEGAALIESATLKLPDRAKLAGMPARDEDDASAKKKK